MVLKMYTYSKEFYSVRKRNENMLFVGKWMEIMVLSSQTQKDQYHMFSLICGI
jgi:hypothetical protein